MVQTTTKLSQTTTNEQNINKIKSSFKNHKNPNLFRFVTHSTNFIKVISNFIFLKNDT